jgi:hypothetical protein
MKADPHVLTVRYTKVGAKMLVDFVNTRPERFERFNKSWHDKTGMFWTGPVDGLAQSFFEVQHTVREIWEGKRQGDEERLVNIGLGLTYPRPEYKDLGTSWSPLQVGWSESGFRLAPRDLNDLVWLTLLQHSSHLAICANREGGCVTPYFLRRKPAYKYCSDACAKPAQRAFKLQWWNEHGEKWRQKRLRKKTKGRRSAKQ